VRELRARAYPARILLVTAGLPNPDALELVRLGVAGIVHKHHTPDALHRSITEVASGAVHIEQRYLQTLIESATGWPGRPRFTAREREVVRLLLEASRTRRSARRSARPKAP